MVGIRSKGGLGRDKQSEWQKMTGNGRNLSRKQYKFIQALAIGQSIAAAAKANGIAERTAYRWLDLPAIQAERTRLEDELRQAEEAEITRIMTTGYAAVHERVKALDYQAKQMEEPFESWNGKTYHLRNSPEHMREWRGLLDDIAKETGGRVKKAELTGKDGGAIQIQPVEIYKVRLPDNGRDSTEG